MNSTSTSSLHLLLDIDGVLQFERPNFETQLREALNWKGDHRAFRDVLFRDSQYHAALRGKADFLAVLKQLLFTHQSGLDAARYLDSWMSDFSLNGELIDSLSRVKSQSISLASNQERWRGGRIADAYAKYPHIGRAFFSYEIGYRKPEREYFEHILSELDVGPEAILFVDDVIENIEAAASLGIRCVRFESNSQLCEVLARLGLL